MTARDDSAAHPLLSIGLPVWNGANYLASALDSILGQTFTDFEVIVVDNASDDETGSIALDYAAQDPRIRYVRHAENIGAARNYNAAFELATGRYFKWAAHDDVCYPTMFERCIDALERGGDSVVMAYTLGALIDDTGAVMRSPLDCIGDNRGRPHRRVATVLKGLSLVDPIFGVYRAGVLRRTGLIGTIEASDYVLLVEVAQMGRIDQVDEVLFGLRQHAGRSMTANRSRRDRISWFDPSAARSRRPMMPGWVQIVWRMEQATWRNHLSPIDKLLCSATIPAVHYSRRSRVHLGGLRRRLAQRLGVSAS